MSTVKLTLSADESIVREAKRQAKECNTSVSAMFSRFIESLSRSRSQNQDPIGPITRRATGLAKMPKGKTYRGVLEEALMEKYGLKK
jgi:hypothetical protein